MKSYEKGSVAKFKKRENATGFVRRTKMLGAMGFEVATLQQTLFCEN